MGVRAVTRSWWAPSLAGLVVSVVDRPGPLRRHPRPRPCPARRRLVRPHPGDRTRGRRASSTTRSSRCRASPLGRAAHRDGRAGRVPPRGPPRHRPRRTRRSPVWSSRRCGSRRSSSASRPAAGRSPGPRCATCSCSPSAPLPPPRTRTRARRASVAIVASVALIVATVVIGPAVASFPGWASMSLPSFGTGPVGPLQLSDDLDLRQSLGSRSGQVVLRYTVAATRRHGSTRGTVDTTSTSPRGARAVTERVERRPGRRRHRPDRRTAARVHPRRASTAPAWQRTDALELAPWDPTTLLTSEPGHRSAPPRTPTPARSPTSRSTSGRCGNGGCRSRTFPRTVVVDGAWQYDAARDEVVGRRSHLQRPAVLHAGPDPRPDQGRPRDGAQVGDPRDDGATLEVPETSHTRRHRRRRRAEITADASNTVYQQAMALQSLLPRDVELHVRHPRRTLALGRRGLGLPPVDRTATACSSPPR